jgi:hypothetical protein
MEIDGIIEKNIKLYISGAFGATEKTLGQN